MRQALLATCYEPSLRSPDTVLMRAILSLIGLAATGDELGSSAERVSSYQSHFDPPSW